MGIFETQTKTPIISNYPFASLHATEEWHLELKCTFLLHQCLRGQHIQLWPLFESGTITIPDTFTRLYLTDQTNNSVHFLRSAAMGFAMSRCIMQAANISRHHINMFLIMLTIHKRQHPLNNGLWESYLQESMMPDQRSGTAPPPGVRQDASLTTLQLGNQHMDSCSYPQNAHEPWAIHMQWMADDFMQRIHRIRPSTQSLRWRTDYADVTVWTRHVECPVPGLRIEGMQSGRMFLAPFITAQTVPHAFATPPVRTQATTEPTPTTWEENTMEVDGDVEGRDVKPEETLPPPPPPKNT